MIAAKKRIVAFLSTTPNPPSSYLLPEFQYIYETAYENTSPGNFSCAKDRGSGSIPLINQFIYQDGLIQQPNETYSAVINGNSGLGNMRDRITGCGVKAGFVLVDFFRGDKELQIVDAINGVEDATGRKSVPALDRDGSASTKDGESAATSLKAGWGLAVGLFSVGVMMATL